MNKTELRVLSNDFAKAWMAYLYGDYLDASLDGHEEATARLKGWFENQFNIAVYDDNGQLAINTYGLNKVNNSIKVSMDWLTKVRGRVMGDYFEDAIYELSNLILRLNESGVSPDEIYFEFDYKRKVTKVKVDGKEVI